MTSPQPLTPQQKLEYLCAKLETLQREIVAVTGYAPAGITIGVHIRVLPHESDGLLAAADDLGFERDEWDNQPTGGAWDYSLDEDGLVSLRIIDSDMPHQPPDTIIAIDPRDEVLGRGFVEVLNGAES